MITTAAAMGGPPVADTLPRRSGSANELVAAIRNPEKAIDPLPRRTSLP